MAVTPARRRPRVARKLIAVGLASVCVGGAWLTPASAAEVDESRASARQLSGELLGTNLDEIAELSGAEVENLGGTEDVIEANPLELSVLETTLIDIPGGLQVPLKDIIEVGAANQYGAAHPGGTSHAGVGAVSDNGGVGSGTDAGFPSNANFDLSNLLGEELTDVLADVELELGALSAEAHLVAPTDGTGEYSPARDYAIGSGHLVLEVPAIADLVAGIEGKVGEVDEAVNSLAGEGGVIAEALKALEPLTAVLEALGADAEITATIETDLQGALDKVLDLPVGAGGPVEIDLRNGTISIDLDALLEGGLNGQPANTEVIGQAVIDGLSATLGDALDQLLTQVTDAVSEALMAAEVNVKVFAEAALVGTLDLSLNATLAEILSGDATVENNSAGIAGVVGSLLEPAIEAIVPAIGGVIEDVLTGADGKLTTLGSTLAGLVDQLTDALDPALQKLAEVLSVKLNVQPDQPEGSAREQLLAVSPFAHDAADAVSGEFSVAAVQVTVLQGEEPAAKVALSKASVGPNAVDEPETEVDGTEVDGTETETGGTDDGNAEGDLPNTGAGNTWLIAAGVALLLAGGATAFAVNRKRGLIEQ